jgi:hypothetical protein
VESEGEYNPFTPSQTAIISFQTIAFILGTHFHSPPHLWDNQPKDRVYLDYLFVRMAQAQQAKHMESSQQEAARYNATQSKNQRGKSIRTTSDSAELEDFFDRVNQDLRTE